MTAATGSATPLPDVERRLRHLELTVSRRLDGLLRGQYLGLLPGGGAEFEGTREYHPGEDDARRLDWAVTARTGVPHVRRTVADRELGVHLVVDASASMDFGTAEMEKRDLAAGAATAVGLLTAGVGNRLGASVLRPDGVHHLPARTGRPHLLAVLRTLLRAPRTPAGATGPRLAQGLSAAAAALPRRGLVVVIADFLDDLGTEADEPRFEWERPLRRLVAQHQVLCVEVLDPRELELPDVGVISLVDPESGRRREVATGDARLRRRYAEAARAHRAGIAAAVRRCGATHLALRTDRDWVADVARHTVAQRRLRHAGRRLAAAERVAVAERIESSDRGTAMTFLSPGRLWLLLAVLALLVAYVVVQRRRGRYAVRFTSLHLLDRVAPDRPGWRRHVPAGLYLVMLGLLVVGFARPADDVRVPRERATVVVAVDVSNSMLADDVDPDRLNAARAAAAAFVQGLPERYSVGLVAFAGEATTLVTPVRDRPAVVNRIESLSPQAVGQQGTAIGEAIAASLAAVQGTDTDADGEAPPARVVLLSDGANTAGRDPQQAAAEMAMAGLPVDAISFGTAYGEVEQGEQVIPVPVDGATLREVAEVTGGSYHEAGSAAELDQVYADISGAVGYEVERQDVTARLVGAALLFALAAAAASLLWFSRLP